MGHQHVCRGGWSLGHGVMLAASEGDGVWDGNLPLAGKLQVREAEHLRAGRPPPTPQRWMQDRHVPCGRTSPGKQPAAQKCWEEAGLDHVETNRLLTLPLSLTISLGQEKMPGKRPLAGPQPGPSPAPKRVERGSGERGRKKGEKGHLREKRMPSKHLDTFQSPEEQTPKGWSLSTIPYV